MTSAGGRPPNEAARNRIFVRDFVLPIRVGAYAHERDKLQRVRFNIEVEVLRPLHPTADMRDVRGVLVYCADYRCGHSIALSGDPNPRPFVA